MKKFKNATMNDVFAGIIVAFISIPISMGYAQVAGLPMVYGLYGSLVPILVFSLFTTSHDFVFGVDAAPAALTGSALATLGITAGTKEAMQVVPVIALMVALWLIFFSIIKAGRAVKYISTPVMGGFVTGICLSIIMMLVPKLFGGTTGTGEIFELVNHIIKELPLFNGLSFVLGMSTLVIILVVKRINKKILGGDMSKKIIGLLVIVFSVFCCILGGTACNKNQEEQAFTLKINESNIVITEFFNEQLTTNYSGEGTVQWSVENESIISVNNGNVKGISAGSSKVFAEVDGKKAETLVTVKAFDENLLSIDLERYVISLEVGEAKTIQPKMQYDGKDIESAFSYESLASDYFTVDANGKIIALKLGQKTCIITGVFNGYEKSISLNVDVISNTSISFASDSVYLYTENLDNEHPSKQQINLTVRENGKIIEQPDIEYIQAVDQDVYVVEDGQIVAKNAGSSKLTVSYTDSKNVCITKDVAVIVKPVDKKVNDKLTIETDGEYEIDINEFVNTSDEVKGLYTLTKDGLKTVASYEAGLITFASVVYGQVSIVAETRNVNYFIDADIDWQIFITNDNVELLKGVSGESIYLSEDIDLNNQNWSSLADYSGNFDGQGFAIKNISVADSSGLFKSFNGTIKDVKFENVTLNGNSGVLAYSSQNANATTTGNEITEKPETVNVVVMVDGSEKYRGKADVNNDEFSPCKVEGTGTHIVTVRVGSSYTRERHINLDDYDNNGSVIFHNGTVND